MTRRLRSAAAAAIATILVTGTAQAQGVPTFDAASVAQAIAQLEQMRQDYANQLEQLQSMTGDKAIAGILNGAQDIAARESADSLSSIMSGAMTGAAIPGNSSALTARIEELKTTFDLPDINAFLTSDVPQDRALATQAGAGLAAVATAEDTYARANTSMGRVNELMGQIDANADLKASVDYNTRMLGEIAVLLNESLRLQAAQTNATGTDALLAAREQAASRTFMRVGDN